MRDKYLFLLMDAEPDEPVTLPRDAIAEAQGLGVGDTFTVTLPKNQRLDFVVLADEGNEWILRRIE